MFNIFSKNSTNKKFEQPESLYGLAMIFILDLEKGKKFIKEWNLELVKNTRNYYKEYIC